MFLVFWPFSVESGIYAGCAEPDESFLDLPGHSLEAKERSMARTGKVDMNERNIPLENLHVFKGMSGWLILVEYAMRKEQLMLARQRAGELHDTEDRLRPISLKQTDRRKSDP